MKLVDNWDEALGWISMRMIGLALIWESIPAEAKAVLPEAMQHWTTIVLLVGAGIGRMVKQGKGAPVEDEA